MPTCIYCTRDSSGSVSIPHVMPEALAQNNLTLPIGTECDACNAYAGTKLEPHVLKHPDVAFAIQLLGAPGKRGKARSEIGGVSRTRVDDDHVLLKFRVRGRLGTGRDGKTRFEGRVPPQSGFNFPRFRRALHHIGLNFVAADSGATAALQPKYDAVRSYIKNPKPPTQSWAYGQLERKDFPPLIGVGFIEFGDLELVGIRIFGATFAVDLTNTGRLVEAMHACGGTYVASDAAEPPHTPIQVADRERS